MPSGTVARDWAASRVRARVPEDVAWLCRAARCSWSWKGESSYLSVSDQAHGAHASFTDVAVGLLTFSSGTTGGPVAISAALVPGCTLRLECASKSVCSICVGCRLAVAPPDGDLGPS
jgi:hypothetical protein